MRPAERLGTGRRRTNAIAGSVAAVLLAAELPAAADERTWISSADAGHVVALYGTPASDDVVVGLDCAAATRTLEISVATRPKNGRNGMRSDLRLASPGGSVAVAARGLLNEMDDSVVFGATTRLDAALRSVLAAKGTLSVTVAGTTVEAPLAGSTAAMAALTAACAAP